MLQLIVDQNCKLYLYTLAPGFSPRVATDAWYQGFPLGLQLMLGMEGTNTYVFLFLEGLSSHGEEKLIDIQKKIMPWRVLPSTDDVILQSELDKKKDSKTSQLVLCAVLVDKIPNLGGLCRTAEIFGVGTLIVGSHRYVEDKGFKSLSVSAERWLNIEQVLPIKLASYLKEMRSNGYHLVGVEQTANSKMIGQYNFPQKTVLVLGNEKTGLIFFNLYIIFVCSYGYYHCVGHYKDKAILHRSAHMQACMYTHTLILILLNSPIYSYISCGMISISHVDWDQ